MSSCPRCKTVITMVAPGRTRSGATEMTIEQAIAYNHRAAIDCGHCGYELYDGRGGLDVSKGKSSRLRDSYVRESQLRSADGRVHYGMLNRLKKRGYVVPANFRGSSHSLARAIGTSHEELARMWKTSTRELRERGVFEISD